jgi:hypothetical protein
MKLNYCLLLSVEVKYYIHKIFLFQQSNVIMLLLLLKRKRVLKNMLMAYYCIF